jgi:hypothetical protein
MWMFSHSSKDQRFVEQHYINMSFKWEARKLMKKLFFMLLMILITVTANANAETLNGEAIIKKAEDALLAWRSGTRKLVITVKEGSKVTSILAARNATKEFPDGRHSLLVMLEPESIKGSAHLFWRRTDKTTAEWVYSPTIRRIRSISGLTAYDSFFGTDFTYADLGIKDPGGTHRLLGEEVREGVKTYKVETIPRERWYYSRIISWISSDTYLPVQRDYYDSNDRHWKTKLFENVITIDNTPKPLLVRMLDLQRNHSTEVSISDVCYDVEYLTKKDFDPEKLDEATRSPICAVKKMRRE